MLFSLFHFHVLFRLPTLMTLPLLILKGARASFKQGSLHEVLTGRVSYLLGLFLQCLNNLRIEAKRFRVEITAENRNYNNDNNNNKNTDASSSNINPEIRDFKYDNRTQQQKVRPQLCSNKITHSHSNVVNKQIFILSDKHRYRHNETVIKCTAP